MGKTRIIAETGAGQHGVATATVCALFGLPCEIYMGAVDVERQALNVFRMQLLGATVHAVHDRHGDAQGRDERSAARLGHQRAHHALRDRLRRRPASLSDAGARAAGGDRPRSARADPEGRGTPARRLRRLRRRRLERDGPVSRVRPRQRRRALRRRGGGRGPRHRPARRDADAGPRRRAARRAVVRAVRRRGPDRRGALDLGRPRLPGRRARALVSQGDRPRALPVGHRRGGARRLQAAGAHRGDPRGARELARHRGAAARSRRACPRARWSLLNLSGRGDKDMGTIAKRLGVAL